MDQSQDHKAAAPTPCERLETELLDPGAFKFVRQIIPYRIQRVYQRPKTRPDDVSRQGPGDPGLNEETDLDIVKMFWLFAVEANQIVERFLCEQMTFQGHEGEIVPEGKCACTRLMKISASASI